jgi:hypothetical protein
MCGTPANVSTNTYPDPIGSHLAATLSDWAGAWGRGRRDLSHWTGA